jgi:hypothetical protein
MEGSCYGHDDVEKAYRNLVGKSHGKNVPLYDRVNGKMI